MSSINWPTDLDRLSVAFHQGRAATEWSEPPYGGPGPWWEAYVIGCHFTEQGLDDDARLVRLEISLGRRAFVFESFTGTFRYWVLGDGAVHAEEVCETRPVGPPPPAPTLKDFRVNLRAIRLLTATVGVSAVDAAGAEAEALKFARSENIRWDETDAEDIQVEGFE